MAYFALALISRLLWASAPNVSPQEMEVQVFRPSAKLTFAQLERMIVAHAPSLDASVLELELAKSGLRQSRLLPNPNVDLGWGTIPVGRLNPSGLARPLANVPNYTAGLSFTIPAGKRRPEIRRATALRDANQARHDATVRALTLELAMVMGQLAVATLRREGMISLVDNARRAVETARTRVDGSIATRLDYDRRNIDLHRSEQLLHSPASDISDALADCAGLVAMRCEGFASQAEARAFLDSWIDAGIPPGRPAERADLKALAALESAAVAEQQRGRAEGIPSPTLRFGYFHDRFIISGNQMNSLNLSVSFPLPIFDHGQAIVDAARAKQARFASERRRRIVASEMRIQALLRFVETQRKRQDTLTLEIIPEARAVLQDVEEAANNGQVSLSDVFQTRRTMSELLIEEADSYADAFRAYLELLAEFPRVEP